MELSVAYKLFACALFALVVFAVTAIIIGPERKALWFQKRTKYSFLNRRGIFGEIVHFGYPKTIEGGLVTLCMLVAIGTCSYIIFSI